MIVRFSRVGISRLTVVTLAASLAAAWGCGPRRDPLVVKAEAVFKDQMAKDTLYAGYGLDTAARATTPFTEVLIGEYLVSDNQEAVSRAVEAAARRPNPSFREPLQSVFDSRLGIAKVRAAVALARLEDEAAKQWLRDHVVDASGLPNAEVIRYLAEAGEDDLIRPVLEKGLEAKQQEERDRIYALLGEIGAPWSADVIANGFSKEFGEGRREAIVALGRTGGPKAAGLIRKYVNTRGLVFATIEALGNLGDVKAEPAIRVMLRNPEKEVKLYAAVALWKLGDEEVAEKTLGPMIQDEDVALRQKLAEQLAGVEDEKALSMLATLAADPEGKVRAGALRVLRERQERKLMPIFQERIGDPEYTVSALAMDALATVGDASNLEELSPLLDSENGYVAISAANAILEIKARVAAEATPG